jgi:hypothetical protein
LFLATRLRAGSGQLPPPREFSREQMEHDIVSLDRSVIFAASKDRRILFTALAYSGTLLTHKC